MIDVAHRMTRTPSRHPSPKIISIFKADLVAFNKEILQISEIKDLQPATTIPCCHANESRQILVSLALKNTQIVLFPK